VSGIGGFSIMFIETIPFYTKEVAGTQPNVLQASFTLSEFSSGTVAPKSNPNIPFTN